MSWLGTLTNMYDYLSEKSEENPDKTKDLAPPATLFQNAQLEIVLSENGELLRGNLISKEEAPTMIPVTLNSDIRTNKPYPHALFDNLEYLAGDLEDYLPTNNTKEQEYQAKVRTNYFLPYVEQLRKWTKFEAKNKFLQIIYGYLKEERLTKDLIKLELLKLDEFNKIDANFKHQSTSQNKFFVRIGIQLKEEGEKIYKLWNERDFLKSYSDYYLSQCLDQKDVCYVTGKILPIKTMHGKGIRWAGDGAKLISSNDKDNFTYRGRFLEPNEAFCVSYEVSEKAHSALRWLIRNQAYSNNGFVLLAYGTEDKIIQPFEDTEQASFSFFAKVSDEMSPSVIETEKDFSKSLGEAIRGHIYQLDPDKKINIIALDNATPGRLSIQYYREMGASEYLNNLAYYHKSVSWLHRYKKDNQNKIYNYIGAPSSMDLINYVFGVERNNFMTLGDKDKYRNQLLQRLLPCIIEKAPIPKDFVKQAFESAICPLTKSYYNWQRSLTIACGIMKKYYSEIKNQKERKEFTMALDMKLDDRSYLYGRLLAIAEKIERDSLQQKDKSYDRQTNAMRFMNALAKKPYSTWTNIELKLQPYLKSIASGNREYYQKKIGEVMDLFSVDDYTSNKTLDGKFLLGFHCQLQDFYKKKPENNIDNATLEI